MRKRRLRKEREKINSGSVFLESDRSVTISRCEKVEKYCPDEVILRLPDMRLTIKGKNMSFAVCYGSEIRLTGKIEELKIVN